MRTAVTEVFGIDVPILAFSHCRDVVAAVTKAGGMGVLGSAAHSPRQLEIDLDWIEAEVGDRPYGVDLIVPSSYAGSEAGGLSIEDVRALIPPQHRAFVADILNRYDVPELPDTSDPEGESSFRGGAVGDAGAGMIFSAERADPQLEIALAHRTALVVNALGPPTEHMIDRAKAEGRRIGALAGAAHHAERHVRAGVDLIVAQG
ncbi:MAG: nitronate monooxygenase, partial [Acidimicrobiales bacterium]